MQALPPSDTPSRDETPLASYVLRVRGRPATLRFELLDLRSGERHVFKRTDSVVAFLQQHGLLSAAGEAAPEPPADPASAD